MNFRSGLVILFNNAVKDNMHGNATNHQAGSKY